MVSAASGKTWVVRPDGTGDAPTIAAGLDSAAAGDTVMAMCGTYYEHDITMKSGVYLTSETGLPDCVTIDAQDLGRVLYCDMADSTTYLVGLTITNGYLLDDPTEGGGMYASHSHLRVSNCDFTRNFAVRKGGGVAIYNSRAIFSGCAFVQNAKGSTGQLEGMGGGVYASGGFPKFYECTFSGNTASSSGEGGGFGCESCYPTFEGCVFEGNTGGRTGGIHCGWGGEITVSGCIFRGNSGGAGPGGIFSGADGSVTGCLFERNKGVLEGGGIVCMRADLIIADCIFTRDTCNTYAGAIYCYEASPIVTRCQFLDNKALRGGAVMVDRLSSAYLADCLFVRNVSKQDGGAILVRGNSEVTLERCTLSGNKAVTSGAGISCTDTSSATSGNCIVAFSVSGGAVNSDGTGTVPMLTCCDLYGNVGGDWTGTIADQYGVSGNISEDPLFCDAASDDYTLNDQSPCAPDNSPAGCGLIGACDVGCGVAGVGGHSGPGVAGLRLDPVVPNPFGGIAEIAYSVPGGEAASRVVLEIFDVQGRRVRSLADDYVPAGDHRVTWDGRDDRGRRAAAGIYFCRLEWKAEIRTRPLVLSH
jgi:hypothetical protein